MAPMITLGEFMIHYYVVLALSFHTPWADAPQVRTNNNVVVASLHQPRCVITQAFIPLNNMSAKIIYAKMFIIINISSGLCNLHMGR